MAKKGTTGGPRAHRTTNEDVERRKQYISRAEKERRWQRRIMIITGVLVAFSIIVLVVGIINDQVIVPRQAITTVNGDEVSTRDYQERVKLTRWLTANQIREAYFFLGGDINTLQQYVGQQISDLQRPLIIGSQVLDEMEEELVLAQGAEALGVEVDPSVVDREVEDYMAQRMGVTHPDRPTATPTTEPTPAPTRLVPSATPQPTATVEVTPAVDAEGNPLPTATPTIEPTATPEPDPADVIATIEAEQDRWLDEATDATDVDSDVARDLFYYQALREAVRDHLGQDIPTEELQVNARHMLFAFNPDAPQGTGLEPTEEEKDAALERAEAAMAALQDGEPFATLAREVSDDTGSAANGGELGWASPDTYVEAFKEAVLNGTIGDILGPIETEFGYHIIQVNGREVRALSSSELLTRQNEAFQTWLDGLKAEADIERHDDWLDRIPEEPTFNDLLGDILAVQ